MRIALSHFSTACWQWGTLCMNGPCAINGSGCFSKTTADRRSWSPARIHSSVSSILGRISCIKKPPLSSHSGRYGDQPIQPPFELLASHPKNVDRFRKVQDQAAHSAGLKQCGIGGIRKHNTKIQRAIGSIVAASDGTEQIDLFGLIEFHHSADQLSNGLVSAHSDVTMRTLVDIKC